MMNDAMVRTPDGKIPVAEVFAENGVVFLKFKKPRSQVYEIVTLDHFLSGLLQSIQGMIVMNILAVFQVWMSASII